MVGEAAIRLGLSRPDLEAMIARGQVETLPIEFGFVVPDVGGRASAKRLIAGSG
jgi:hypothetical protein